MNNCSSIYLNCWNGIGNVAICTKDTLFHPTTKQCESTSVNGKCSRYYSNTYQAEVEHVVETHKPNAVNKVQLDTSVEIISCEVGTADGIYKHPYDCTKFIQCASGRTFIQNCGPGTHFNVALQVCDWPHNANCVSSSSASTSATHNLASATSHHHYHNKLNEITKDVEYVQASELRPIEQPYVNYNNRQHHSKHLQPFAHTTQIPLTESPVLNYNYREQYTKNVPHYSSPYSIVHKHDTTNSYRRSSTAIPPPTQQAMEEAEKLLADVYKHDSTNSYYRTTTSVPPPSAHSMEEAEKLLASYTETDNLINSIFDMNPKGYNRRVETEHFLPKPEKIVFEKSYATPQSSKLVDAADEPSLIDYRFSADEDAVKTFDCNNGLNIAMSEVTFY